MRDSVISTATSQGEFDYAALSCGLPIDEEKVASKTEENDPTDETETKRGGGQSSMIVNVKLPRPLGRMYSDGEDTTYSVESRKTHSIRVIGLSLSFEDSKLESNYQKWTRESETFWMWNMFLFQAIAELALGAMNLFSYFEETLEYQNGEHGSGKVHVAVMIGFHVLSFAAFMFFAFASRYESRLIDQHWNYAVSFWFTCYSSLHMFMNFELPFQPDTGVANGLLVAMHTVQIMLLSRLPWIFSTASMFVFATTLYISVLCSSGQCGDLHGVDGDTYGHGTDFREWGLGAVVLTHVLFWISVSYFQFRHELNQREVFVRAQKLKEQFLKSKLKAEINPLSMQRYARTNEMKAVDSFSILSIPTEKMSEIDLDVDERAVLDMSPMIRWFLFGGGDSDGPKSRSSTMSRPSSFSFKESNRNRSCRKFVDDAVGKWHISFKNLNFDNSDDEKPRFGGAGKVTKAQYFGADVALKEINELLINEDATSFQREIDILSKVSNHPNIVDFLGISKRFDADLAHNRIYFLTAWCHEDLECYLSRAPAVGGFGATDSKSRSFAVSLVSIARQVAGALAHSHSRGITHRDIKPANVLLTEHAEVKLCDFGLAKSWRMKKKRTRPASVESGEGTIAYKAVELFDDEVDTPTGFTGWKRVDVWAYGVLLVAMLTQNRPFSHNKRWTSSFLGNAFRKAVVGGLKPEPPRNTPTYFRDLIEKSLASMPKRRPDFKSILNELLLRETHARKINVVDSIVL